MRKAKTVDETQTRLNPKHKDEGAVVLLSVVVRSALLQRLKKIAEREGRSLDYVVDEVLRWAVDEYVSAGSLAGLLASGTEPSDEAAQEDLKKICNT